MNDLIFLSAVEMAEQVHSRKISPIELVDAHLAQIEKLNAKLNAFVEIDAHRARRFAHDAEIAVISRPAARSALQHQELNQRHSLQQQCGEWKKPLLA